MLASFLALLQSVAAEPQPPITASCRNVAASAADWETPLVVPVTTELLICRAGPEWSCCNEGRHDRAGRAELSDMPARPAWTIKRNASFDGSLTGELTHQMGDDNATCGTFAGIERK